MLTLALLCLGVLYSPEREFLDNIAPWKPVSEPHVWWSPEHSCLRIAVLAEQENKRAVCTGFQPYRTMGFIFLDCSVLFS